MKCPKCDYLGFDTGERCRNCGYDFSLIAAVPGPRGDVEADRDLPLRSPPSGPESVSWPEHLDRSLGDPVTQGGIESVPPRDARPDRSSLRDVNRPAAVPFPHARRADAAAPVARPA